MTYTEFRETYPWMVKAYPTTRKLYAEDMNETIGTITIERFTNENGIWKLTDTETKNGISREYYCNTIDAIPFFRDLGGTEHIERTKTPYGTIPTEIISVSPDKEMRTVRKFTFD